MKKIIALLICISVLQSGFSQKDSKEEKIKELLELTGSGKIGLQVFENIVNDFQKSFKSVPEEFWVKFKAEAKAEDFVNMIMPVYAKYYTETEINQLLEFYKSPIGKKVISTMPQLMQESMQIGQEWGEKLAEKIYNQLEEKGYKKDA
jgi:N-glycosylase/DNA lyase